MERGSKWQEVLHAGRELGMLEVLHYISNNSEEDFDMISVVP